APVQSCCQKKNPGALYQRNSGQLAKNRISLIDPVSGPRPATSQLRPAPPQRSTSSSSQLKLSSSTTRCQLQINTNPSLSTSTSFSTSTSSASAPAQHQLRSNSPMQL